MLVRITKNSSPNLWYSDLIGSLFVVYVYDGRPYLWVSRFMYIDPDDVEEILYQEKEETILAVQFESGIA